MIHSNDLLIKEMIHNFVHYGHSKSGGHGGQKVNKKETKSELYFDIDKCDLLNDKQKELLERVYHNRINKKKVLHMNCSEERSLHSNQKKVTSHFHHLMENILTGNPHHLRGHHKKKH